mmetsp:Transcript_18995/g.44520  ORF Transcript_18995/g.44520 Transcript_18995/m.44520 type:complete len:249 (+) Transcript_18995:233-979(+)
MLLHPSGHPESLQGNVAENQGARGNRQRSPRHGSIGDHCAVISDHAGDVSGRGATHTVQPKLRRHVCNQGAHGVRCGVSVINNHRASECLEMLNSLGQHVIFFTNEVDGLDPPCSSNLNHSLAHHAVGAVLYHHVACFQLLEILEHAKCSAGVHRESCGVLHGNIVSDWDHIILSTDRMCPPHSKLGSRGDDALIHLQVLHIGANCLDDAATLQPSNRREGFLLAIVALDGIEICGVDRRCKNPHKDL